MTKLVEASDVVFSEFSDSKAGLDSIVVRSIEIRKKETDKPIGIFKSVIAAIANINTFHHFLVFTTDRFLMAVDFYSDNRLVLRMGDHSFVYDVTRSQKR